MKTTLSPFVPSCLRATKVALSNKVFILLSAFCFLLFGAVAYGQSPNCYRITFSDKNDSPYSVNHPEEFLSARAIAKRERFNIPVIEQDLPVNPHYIDSILNFSTEPSQIIAISKWNNSVVIFYPETNSCHAIIDEMLNHFSFVIDTLPVAYYKLPFVSETSIQKQRSNTIAYSSSTCDYDYGKSIDNIHLHKGELLHKAGFCGEGMLICAFDSNWSGLDTISYYKPLYQNGQICGSRDLVPGMNNVYIANPLAIPGHGTATFSEMASCIEGKMVGSAPQANYFLIRTENPWGENLVEEDFYAYGAEIADSLGADVVTASIGYSTFDYEWQNIYTPINNNGISSIASRAASILAQKGVIVVISAGNEGLTGWHNITHPADASNILAVGNVNKNGQVSPTSSYGPSADGRIKPDVASVGWGSWFVWSNGQIMQEVGGYGGTSGAAPIIAGLATCLWQALPQFSALEITDLIRKYGNRADNPDDRTGYGIPNFYQCYLDQTFGVAENVKPEVLVYPNPTTGQLTINNEQLTINNVEVFDVYGKNLSSHHLIVTSSNQINISHLPTGIYFVKISTETGRVVKKVVKM